MTRDRTVLFAAFSLRSFAYGFLATILALYLEAIGMTPGRIGAVFTAALAGGAGMTLLLTVAARRLGNRSVLVLAALLMALAGVVFAIARQPWLLVPAAALGTISPSGKEVGPFLSVEQAVLPQTAAPGRRTAVFALFNLLGSLAGALGALAVTLPGLFGLSEADAYRSLLWAYAAAGLILALLYARLSRSTAVPAAAPAAVPRGTRRRAAAPIVVRLAGLFALDAFAGGFVVQGLVAYYFHLRYGADAGTVGAILFGTSLLSALSFLAAAPLARRIGLLNTMVFTHLPSNVLLLLVPLMPGFYSAVGMLLARHLLSQLDVPTRQSYTMAIVEPSQRAPAAGVTSVARTAGAAVAPAFAGPALAVPALGIPFLVAGSLKIVYDLALLASFRRIRPPEEERAAASDGRPPAVR